MVRLLEAHHDYREKVAFVPQHFINGYHDHRNADGSVDDDAEVVDWDFRQGDLLIHFAGPGVKQYMPVYMEIAMQHDAAWEMPLEQTTLPREIAEFWDREREKRQERWQSEMRPADSQEGEIEEENGEGGDEEEEENGGGEGEGEGEEEEEEVYVEDGAEEQVEQDEQGESEEEDSVYLVERSTREWTRRSHVDSVPSLRG